MTTDPLNPPPAGGQAESPPPLRISRLVERDYMRIESLDITPGKSSLIVLKGPNEAGKTSAMRGVISALQGKKTDPEQPIRTGQKSGSVEITLADDVADRFRVSASWTPAGRYLTLREILADGTQARLPAGQTVVQSMTGTLSFHPLKFMGLQGPARLPMLLEALGKRQEYETLQSRRKAVFDKRTDENRKVRETAAIIAEHPDPSPRETLEVVTDEALKAELEGIEARNAELRQKHEKLAEHQRETKRLATERENKTARIAALQKELAALQATVETLGFEIQTRQAKETEYTAKMADLKPTPTETVLERINANRVHNQNVARQQEARKLEAELDQAKKNTQKFTGVLEAIDGQVLDLVQHSNLAENIPGIGVTPQGDLTYNDLPLEQASGKRQLELSCLIGMAANPRLRVMCFDEGDRLDPDSIKLLGNIAEKEGYQLWMTAVYAGQADEHTHVVQLLDGMIEGAPKPADPQAAIADMYENTEVAEGDQPASEAAASPSSVVELDDLEL